MTVQIRIGKRVAQIGGKPDTSDMGVSISWLYLYISPAKMPLKIR